MNHIRELHYRYIVSYLILSIILLVALAYYNVPNLVDKLSFALTLSSLVLAILAIFYTIVSAQKQESQLAKLVETNVNLGNTANDISSAANEMRTFAREAPQHFQKLDNKLDSMNANYEVIKLSPAQVQKEEIKSLSSNFKIDRPQFVHMFRHLQFSAMAVLYLFTRAYSKSIPIEPEAFDKLDINSFDYAVGVLNGLATTEIISFKIHKGAIVPVSCKDFVSEEIPVSLKRIQSVISQSTSDRLQKKILDIDAYINKPVAE